MRVRTRFPQILAVAAVLGLLTGCASVPLKERVTQGVQVVHTAVNTAQSAEIAVWESGVLAEQWTDAKRRTFHAALVRYYDASTRVTTTLVTWRAGDPVPTTLPQQLMVAYEALGEAIKVAPPGGFESVLEQLQLGVRALIDLINLAKGGTS